MTMLPWSGTPERHILTLAIEDYFQVAAFNRIIQRGHWYRFERRVEQGTERALELLEEAGTTATFFVLGWVADNLPEVVRRVADAGHEVASKGYYHRGIRNMTPAEFREDLARAEEAIARAAGRRVAGYRVADGWFGPSDLWALDVLAEAGYRYDSSIAPIGRTFAAEPRRRFPHEHTHAGRTILELPISSIAVLGFDVPFGGGNYWRQLPVAWTRRRIARWDGLLAVPMVLYAHTWELDTSQPRITAAPLVNRIRHYRNLGRTAAMLHWCLQNYRFTSAADYMNLELGPVPPGDGAQPGGDPLRPAPEVAAPDRGPEAGADRTPITIVAPCYNEEGVLPYLANTLRSVERELTDRYDVRYVFVDDGSSDDTWQGLQKAFGNWPACKFVRHDRNRGVAAAIMTGIREADTEITASIDCDCTYDPHELARMVPLLEADIDIVTASPYHPQGGVRNVPGWRLFLSRTLSHMYRVVLGHRLHTYTACFRVYRRSAVADMRLHRENFLGIGEVLGRVLLRGGRVVEYPAVLEVRVIGHSKMKVLRTILGHCALLVKLAGNRLRGEPPGPDRSGTPQDAAPPGPPSTADVPAAAPPGPAADEPGRRAVRGSRSSTSAHV